MLARRVRAYQPSQLDELCTSGEVVWVGAGAIGGRDGRIRLCFADQLPMLHPGWDHPEPSDAPLHEAIRTFLADQGASFWGALRGAAPEASDHELLVALWDLVWAGEVTNDSLAPLRSLLSGGGVDPPRRRSARRGPARPTRLTRMGPPAAAGRWGLVAPLAEPAPSPTEAAHAQAMQLLERYGVITRETVLAEGIVGGYASVYPVLKVLEERARARRGYFVAGLGAAQFALPGAVDRLRAERADIGDGAASAVVLAATDPAQPYGASLAWPPSPGRPARSANAVVVLADGELLGWLDRSSHHLVTFDGADVARLVDALAGLVASGHEPSVEIRKVDGAPVPAELRELLLTRGFADGYRGPVLRAGRRP